MMSKQSSVFTMGMKNVTQTQKSMASLVQCESDADCVFWLCIHNQFLPRGQTVNKEYYLKGWNGCEKQWGEKGVTYGGNGFSTMTMLWCIPPFRSVISSKTSRRCSSPSLHTCQTLQYGDFFLFTKQKSVTKGWWFESDKEI
jgi:hypothetical protein